MCVKKCDPPRRGGSPSYSRELAEAASFVTPLCERGCDALRGRAAEGAVSGGVARSSLNRPAISCEPSRFKCLSLRSASRRNWLPVISNRKTAPGCWKNAVLDSPTHRVRHATVDNPGFPGPVAGLNEPIGKDEPHGHVRFRFHGSAGMENDRHAASSRQTPGMDGSPTSRPALHPGRCMV